jgi:hypothetical protein
VRGAMHYHAGGGMKPGRHIASFLAVALLAGVGCGYAAGYNSAVRECVQVLR